MFDQAQQAYDNSKADYESAVASRKTQEEQLAYYTIRAPFDGVVGDIPVHVGDYVSPTTMLTTVDENKDLEAYIYVPTERASQIRMGLEVDLMDTSDKLLEKTKIDFVSPQVDSTLQGILVKAPVHFGPEMLRNCADGEGARHLEHRAHGGHSRARGDSTGRSELCVRGKATERHVRRDADAGHAGRHRGQFVLRYVRVERG